MNELLSHIEKTLAITDFDAALAGYAELYAQSPQFFLQRPYKNKNHLTHVQNAANLARLTLYHKIQPFGEVSARVKAAIEHFVGKRLFSFLLCSVRPISMYLDCAITHFTMSQSLKTLR